MKKDEDRRGGAVSARIVLTLLLLSLCAAVQAASEAKLQDRFEDVSRRVNRARGLTLTVLKQIKQIDSDCRAEGGAPIESRRTEAQNRLARLKPAVEAFNANSDDAAEALSRLREDLAAQSSAAPSVARLEPSAEKLEGDLKKYRTLVQRHWDRSIRDFGEPLGPAPPPIAVATDGPVMIRGEATAGLGSSKYKRPHADPGINASSGDFSFNVRARYTPADRTTVEGRLGHKSTVERSEIGLTDFGASVNHRFSPRAAVMAGLDLTKFSDKENDLVDYTQTGLFARFNGRSAGHNGYVELRRDSRGYSNLSTADYKTLAFTANDAWSVGVGSVKLRLRYLTKTNDIEALDHSEFNPSFVYQFSLGGSQFGISYQRFKMTNVDDSPLANNRLKVHLYGGRSSSTGTKRWGPEVNKYSYPNVDNGGMVDFKFIYQSHKRDRKTTMTSWDLVYRRHEHDLMFDFGQVLFRHNSRPIGKGRYTKLNVAARYYVENSHDTATVDDPLLSPYYSTKLFSPPHTLDVYYSMGWQMLFTSWLQRLSVGPVLSHRAFIDENGDDRTNKESDIDFVVQHPSNFGGIGFEMKAAGVAGYAVSWSFDIKLLHQTYYNADPMRERTTLEWRATSSYPIDDHWSAEGFADMHQTRYDLDSPEDLDKLKLGVQVRYLFDVRR